MKAGEVVARRYRLDARLGIGGMGEVWKATHEATAREFAIKFMHAHAASSATARERFAREARVSARINHPNVIDVFDAGEHDEGTLFLAMELLDGISLADAFHLAPPLSVQDLLVVVHDTARALSAAHAVGVVHRDVKPANVFLHRERQSGFASAKVLDFGISKFGDEDSNHTKTGAVLGSPRYMSPEQTRSAASVDHRADVWAAGVILFEGLTGTWPHEGDSFSSLVVAICTVPPISIDSLAPDLPEPVRSIVRDCLQPIEARIQSAGELADRLAAALQDPGLAQRPLARPLHPPSDSIRATTGVRVRPLLTTTGGSPESLRGSHSRPVQPPAPPPAGLSRSSSSLSMAELLPDLDPEEMATRRIAPSQIAEALGRALQAPPAAAPPWPAPGAPVAASPHTPLHAVQSKTVPLDSGMAMRAELARMGLVPAAPPAPAAAPALPGPTADPLIGTFASLATTTMREPPPPSPAPPVPAAPTFRAPPVVASPSGGAGLRIAAAALSVLLVGILAALFSVVRSGATGQAGPLAPEATPTPPALSAAAPTPPPPPAPEPTATARTPPPSIAPAAPTARAAASPPAPSATASASAPPTEKPRGTPARPASPAAPQSSKIKQLGSGL